MIKYSNSIVISNKEKLYSDGFLTCNYVDKTVYWDDENGHVLWSYPEIVPKTTTTTIITTIKPSTTSITTSITNYSTEYVTKTQTTVITATKFSYSTYTNVSYQGRIGSQYYLGVNELKEFVKIEAKYGGTKNKPMKYTKWLLSSENKPSYMYLANTI